MEEEEPKKNARVLTVICGLGLSSFYGTVRLQRSKRRGYALFCQIDEYAPIVPSARLRRIALIPLQHRGEQ